MARPAKKQALLKKTAGAPGGYKPIDIPQILKIVNEVYSSCAGNSLKQNNSDLPLQQKIIVASLLLMTSYGVRPVKEVTLGKLFDTYTRICKKRGMAGVNLRSVHQLKAFVCLLKIIDSLTSGGQINGPFIALFRSSQHIPGLSLGPLKGFSELKWR